MKRRPFLFGLGAAALVPVAWLATRGGRKRPAKPPTAGPRLVLCLSL